MEILVVLAIVIILGAMTFSAFDGLQNTIKMNEYMLTIEQDIRKVQRSAMLLERDPEEKWLYGLGVDLSSIEDEGRYSFFKWCSTFDDFGNIMTKSDLPGYDPNVEIGTLLVNGDRNAYLPTEVDASSTCEQSIANTELRTLPGYDTSGVLPPKSEIVANDVTYVLFESVSGRAFFYDTQGHLLNYDQDGDPTEPTDFVLTVNPLTGASARRLTISNLSGKITSVTIE